MELRTQAVAALILQYSNLAQHVGLVQRSHHLFRKYLAIIMLRNSSLGARICIVDSLLKKSLLCVRKGYQRGNQKP